MTENQAGQAVGAIMMYRGQLLEAAPLICRLSEKLEVPVSALLPEIAFRGVAKKDSRRMYTPAQRRRIYLRDSGLCFHCGAEVAPDQSDVDHIVPWSAGGRTTDSNGVVSCPRCNRSRGNKLNY